MSKKGLKNEISSKYIPLTINIKDEQQPINETEITKSFINEADTKNDKSE